MFLNTVVIGLYVLYVAYEGEIRYTEMYYNEISDSDVVCRWL